MFGYVIALLVTNTIYLSLGVPVNNTSASYGLLAKPLLILANSCENPFLATQIKSHLNGCSNSSSNSEESEFDCYIFYDINSQLCLAFRGSQQDLGQTYATKINGSQKIDVTCDVLKNEKFTKLADFPMYSKFENTFKSLSLCVRACGAEGLLSEDTNFYCKYFQWGTELLRQVVTNSPLTGNMPSGDSGPDTVLVETPRKDETSSAGPTSTNNSGLVQSQGTNGQLQSGQGKVVPKLEPSQTQNDLPKPDTAPSSTHTGQASGKIVDNTVEQVVQKVDQPPAKTINDTSNNEGVKLDVPPKKKSDEDLLVDANDISEDGNQNKPNQQGDPDDDDEESFGDDGEPQESQLGSDGVDAGLSDPKLDEEKTKKKSEASIVSGANVEISKKEFYSNTIQDGFSEDNDHFFSFFLTAIILVIFLYVLYHNKSKFRKVFLGLLVEGRQSGRRRNSRGHEYRRLDTLEQAMSTNSAAPPSKIIY